MPPIYLKLAMTITNSITARSSLLVLVVSTVNICLAENYSESFEIPNSEWRVESQCSTVAKTSQCTISVNNGSTDEKVLDYPTPLSSASYEKGVFLLTFGCGTACSATYAYKIGGQLGGPFPLVEAADNEREVVMSLGVKSVLFYRMFGNNDEPIHEITPNLGDSNLLDNVEEGNLEDHVFRLHYRHENAIKEIQYEAPL